MLSNIVFESRACPFCGETNREPIIVLKSEDIVSANWSYRPIESLARFGPLGNHEIVKCSNCDFIYAGYLPSQNFLSFVYDELIDVEAARRESFRPHNFASRMEYLSSMLRMLGRGSKVLDFGCGFGPTLALLRNIGDVETVGFETSFARVQELSEWHPLITSDLDRVEALGPFNAIILDNVLEHVPEPRQTVLSIGKLCAEGAFLYVSVPDMNRRYLASQATLNRSGKLLAMDVNPWEHLNYFDLAHLDALLITAGFVPLKQAELPSEVRVGLRPEHNMFPRMKNSFASLFRQARYAITGEALPTANRRFYRYSGHVTAKSVNFSAVGRSRCVA
jgi:SAM-dependent methyltransferase